MTRKQLFALALVTVITISANFLLSTLRQSWQSAAAPSRPLKPSNPPDYTKLAALLKAGEWQEADFETARIIGSQSPPQGGSSLPSADGISHVSCEVFQNIDQLWLKHSQNRFGFSVQRDVYKEMFGKIEMNKPKRTTQDYLDDQATWIEFQEKLGWIYPPDSWKTAPKGFFPTLMYWGFDNWVVEKVISSAEECKL
jgi:hypothetical protein